MSIKRFWKWRYIIPAALVAFPLFVLLVGEIVKLLWNALLPPLFGWPAITLWQGIGLLVLSRLLFGRFGGGGGRRHRRDMTPEERQHFRERLRERMCRTSGPSEAEQAH